MSDKKMDQHKTVIDEKSCIENAKEAIGNKRFSEAIHSLSHILEESPADMSANMYVLLSMAHRLNGSNKLAEAVITEGIKKYSNNVSVIAEHKKIKKMNPLRPATECISQHSGILGKHITISLSYYNDKDHLAKHLTQWAEYSDLCRFQILDDGSTVPVDTVLKEFNIEDMDLRVFRIEEDIPWNIPGVRNLGATVCTTPWILICDMDQTFERSEIIKMLDLVNNEAGVYYSFARKDNVSTRGTMLVSIEDFWKVGGYDEDMVGNYGYNDPLFRKQLEDKNIEEVVASDIYCTQHSADCALDRSTKEINARKMAQKVMGLPRQNWDILRFKWRTLGVNPCDQQGDAHNPAHKTTAAANTDGLPQMHCHDELVSDLGYAGFIPDGTMMRWFNDQYSTSKHLFTLYSIAKGLNAKNIVEIGFGRTSFVLARAAHENGGRLTTCDSNNFSYLLNESERQVVQFINGDAESVWSKCDGGIDFAFLDFFSIPSLDKEFSLHHITRCIQLMKRDAVLALHDSMDNRFKLNEVLPTLIENMNSLGISIELMNLPFNYGLCLIRRKSPSPFGRITDMHKKKDDSGGDAETRITRVRNYTNYGDYIAHQKEKTLDPVRREKWLNEEWQPKLDYFKSEFERFVGLLPENPTGIGLASRTGQEVAAMQELGLNAIGIDIVPNPPLVVLGDLHSVPFSDNSFDFAFTNAVDHALYPDKFMSEARRVLKPNGLFLMHISLDADSDEYGEIVVRHPAALTSLFGDCEIIKSEPMSPWGGMDYRILLRKIH